jgi:GT2 family glycosyltransferase
MLRPRVAVIIVNYNGGGFLSQALDSLADQTVPPARVIVVDNASSDGSPELVRSRYPSVEVLQLGRNAGFAAANNAGVQEVDDCEWVALLNPDAFPRSKWVEELLKSASNRPDCSLFASRMLCAGQPDVLDGTGDLYHVSGIGWRRDHGKPAAESQTADVAGEVFSTCAGAGLYRRSAFLEVGGLDEDYFAYYCDHDLAFRLRLRGHRCWYVPDAVVLHVGSGTAGVASDFGVYYGHRNLVWTFAKNMPWPLALAYLPQHLLVNALSVAMISARGQSRAILRAKRDALRGLPGVIRKRRELQRRRKVSSSELRGAMETGLAAYTATPGARRFFRRHTRQPNRV